MLLDENELGHFRQIFTCRAWAIKPYLSLIPLCSVHEMDEGEDSERERLSTRGCWRRRSEMDKDRER